MPDPVSQAELKRKNVLIRSAFFFDKTTFQTLTKLPKIDILSIP